MNRIHQRWGLFVGVLLLATPALTAAQQAGTIQGKVLRAGNREPIAGAQVSVTGTQRGTITARDGTYRLNGVPAGARELRVTYIGFTSVTRQVNVPAGGSLTEDFDLHETVLNMEELVITGVAGATPRAKLPITVERLTAEAMPVPATNAASMIQGKVAGASVVSPSGRPGSAPSILLRGATTINASGRSQEPLFIVDGVILGSSIADIDAMDIESIEIVKGAAAASLYGSRAASGVVQITTKRGQHVGNDQVSYSVRTEYGGSELPGRFNLTQKHQFKMTADRSQFISANGQPCAWARCPSVSLAGQRAMPGQAANAWNTIQQEEWPGVTYDHVERFFRGGQYMTNYASVSGRSGGTNYHISYNRQNEEGIMPGQDGLLRQTFRLNVDQAVRTDITLSASASYARGRSSLGEGAMFALTRMPAGVDLSATDSTGKVILKPDPFNDNENPLNSMLYLKQWEERGRFLGSATAKWSPLSWFDVDANFSYDRLDRKSETFRPKGYRTLSPSPTQNNGSLSNGFDKIEAYNGSVTAQIRRNFGDNNWTTRTQLRYLIEQRDDESVSTSGYQFGVDGVYTYDNLLSTSFNSGSSFTPTRADGYFVISDVDYKSKYIVSGLVRNDGSSLFGPDQRRQWYYRAALAWRPTEESWFNVPAINELKLRASQGTAGNRPSFAAQYQTYNVGSGTISPVTLGNKDLKPEFATEREFGVEAIVFDRFSLDVVYAFNRIEDQILSVPLPAYNGFSSQWRNAGTVESKTWEATLGAQLIRSGGFGWNARVLFDRNRSMITEVNRPPYTTGVGGQGLGNVFNIRAGERIGTFYGFQFAENCGHLPAGVDCSQFEVNDDGFLVWIGGAGSSKNGWKTYANASGAQQTWWGTTAPITIRGQPITWGTPFQGEGDDPITGERTTFLPLGSSMPDYRLSLANTFTYKAFSLYGLLESVQGFKVYNQPLQWATFQSYSGIMDQSGVANEDERKPVGYFDRLYGASGLQPSSAFVDDASYIKLRELSLRIRPGTDFFNHVPVLRGFDGVTFSVTGRNVKTWSKYDGYDPDVGVGGGNVGSAVIARVDGYNYPSFRTWTFGLELNF